MAYEVYEEDLQNKSARLLEISPYGKVPVIVDHDRLSQGKPTIVFESAIINEYLEETRPETPLMPTDPLERAQARIWSEYSMEVFRPIYRLKYPRDDNERQVQEPRLVGALGRIETHLSEEQRQHRGPWFVGGHFSMADINLLPFLEQGSRLVPDVFERYPAILNWLAAFKQRPSFAATFAE